MPVSTALMRPCASYALEVVWSVCVVCVRACVRVCSGLHELPPFLMLQNTDEFFKDEIDLFHENKQQVCCVSVVPSLP